MDLQQSWTKFLQGEQFMENGHWQQACCIFQEVMTELPAHFETAAQSEDAKPCQLHCILKGFSDSAIYQSEILNKFGRQSLAFEALNTAYGHCQFWKYNTDFQHIMCALNSNANVLFQHMEQFCQAQLSLPTPQTVWQNRLNDMQQAHKNFNLIHTVHHYPDSQPNSSLFMAS